MGFHAGFAPTSHGIIAVMESLPAPSDASLADTPNLRPGGPGGWRLRRWLWILAILALIAFATYESITFLRQPVARRGRFGDAAGPQSVGVATVGRGDIHVSLRALGTVTPLSTVTVNSQISGLLMSVGFKEGQLVRKGQFLAQIDPRPYQVALEQDRAQLARDQAVLEQAQMDLKRYETLVQQQSIQKQTEEDQVFTVQQDQATVDVDKAQVKAQELNLVYCHIVAPVDGRVGLRLVDPGNYVQAAASTGILVIALQNPISVIFSVPEDSLPRIMARVRAGARLPVVAFDRANVRQIAVGEFAAIDNQVDTTTGTVKLRASFENAADALFPSQFVNVVLMLDTLKDVVTVPVAAVQHGAPGTYVYLVDRDNTVSVHTITLGTQDGDWYAVQSGLSPGDRVVTDGVDRLRDGAHVNIPGPQSPAANSALPDNAGGGRRHGRGGGRRGDGAAEGPPAGDAAGTGAPPADATGASDADAAARRERWRQRRQEQQNQQPQPQPQPPPQPPPQQPPNSPPPSGSTPRD
jgi:multidrug efflux system membrane fusion protein